MTADEAVNAAYWQADAEWREYDKTAAKYESIVRAWRKQARAALVAP